jgi:hypothetical protein
LGDPADIAAEARERFPERNRSKRGWYITVSAVLVVALVLGAFLLLRPKGPYAYRGAVLWTGTNHATCLRLADEVDPAATVTASSAGVDMGDGAATYEWTQGGCWLAWSFPLDRAASYMLTFNTQAGVYPGPTFTAGQLEDAGSNMTVQLAEFPDGLSI